MDEGGAESNSARKQKFGSKIKIALSIGYGFFGFSDKFSEWTVGSDRYELNVDYDR